MAATPKRPRRTKAQLEQARRRREAARKTNLRARHDMTTEQYDAIFAYQGGTCFICRRAKGLKRSLAVDHDHSDAREFCTHPHEQSCAQCWRGLLCAPCNRMLAHARDDIEVFHRAITYLRNPPAREWFLGQ